MTRQQTGEDSDNWSTERSAMLRRFGFVCIGFLLILFAWFAFDARREYREIRTEIEDRQKLLAASLAQYAGRLFGGAVENTEVIGRLFSNYLDGSGPERAAALVSVRDSLEKDPFISDLFLVDDSGRILFEDRENGPLQQTIIKGGFNTLGVGGLDVPLRISDVVIDRNKRPYVLFVRRTLLRADGRASGVVIAALNLEIFQHVFDAQRPGKGGGIALFRTDGKLLVRSPYQESLVNRTLTGPLFATHLPKSPAGAFMEKVQIDEMVRVVGYATVAGFPLVVATGIPEAEVFAPWRQSLFERSIAFLIAAAVLASLAWIGYRLFRQEERAWHEQRQMDRKFRELAEAVPAIVYVAGPDGTTTFVNRRWTDVTGQSVEKALVPTWNEFEHPDDAERAAARWQAAVRTAGDYVNDYRLRTADGTYRWHLSRAVPSRDDQGRVVAWYGTVVDVDDIRRTEERARAVESRYQVLVEDIPIGILEAEPDGKLISANPAWRRIFGFSDDEPLDSINVRDLYVDPTERDRNLAKLRLPGQSLSYQAAFRRRDGRTIQIEGHVRRITDATGRLVLLRGTMLDITDRKSLEEQLRQAQKMEAVGQLTGGIAHDFNNLLTVIMGNAESLSESLGDNPRLKHLAELMAMAAQRGADLTRSLLAFARKQTLAPRVTDVNALVSRMEDLLRRTLGEQIEVVLVRGEGLWNAAVDPAQLDSAILNLAVNARDAMPNGGKLTIETANVELDDAYASQNIGAVAGPHVMIAVSDSGAGMTPEVLTRAFDPFFTTKETGKGTGLGLSMVYGYVKQSGGHVKIYSEIGHGTTVRLYLPKSVGPVEPGVAPEEAAGARGGGETILLVEDDDSVRANAKTQLESLGYRVLAAGDGPEALEILREGRPVDLLFTDVVLRGGMNGPQLAEAARRLRPALKVLYTSGYAEGALGSARQHGRRIDLLSKPYRRHDLAVKLRRVLDTPSDPA
jgi:PAS domain S-box-containing protein